MQQNRQTNQHGPTQDPEDPVWDLREWVNRMSASQPPLGCRGSGPEPTLGPHDHGALGECRERSEEAGRELRSYAISTAEGVDEGDPLARVQGAMGRLPGPGIGWEQEHWRP